MAVASLRRRTKGHKLAAHREQTEQVAGGGRAQKMYPAKSVFLSALALFGLLSAPVRAQDVVVGVNVVNPMRASLADQDRVFGPLEAAHVHVIRCDESH
jgi:hypothetical protein